MVCWVEPDDTQVLVINIDHSSVWCGKHSRFPRWNLTTSVSKTIAKKNHILKGTVQDIVQNVPYASDASDN